MPRRPDTKAGRAPAAQPGLRRRAGIAQIETVLTSALERCVAGSDRIDQHLRNQLIFDLGRFAGLRVEEIAGRAAAKIMTLNLGTVPPATLLRLEASACLAGRR